MYLTYNGTQLQVCQLHGWHQDNVYTDDGADYLWTHHRIHVGCVYNPAATGGALPGVSLATLQATLLKPRQPLVVAVGGKTVLSSPQVPDANVDAYLGPKPSCVVHEVHGTQTAIVDFMVDTWVSNETTGADALVAHRWEATHDIDEIFKTTRRVSGTVYLRSDAMAKNKVTADMFRATCFHPIPINFQRGNVSVTPSSDGTRLYYSFSDVEQDLNLGLNNPFTSVEGEYTVGFDNTGNKGWNPSDYLPTRFADLTVRIQGRRNTSRIMLAAGCNLVAAAYGFRNPNGSALSIAGMFLKSQVTVGINGRYASGHYSLLFSGAAGNIAANQARTPNESNLPEGIVAAGVTLASTADGQNPRPIVGGVRGTYAVQCLAQALTVPYGNPAKPTDPGTAKDVVRK